VTSKYELVGQLVIQTNKAKTNPIKAKTKPIQTQFVERAKLMQHVYIKRIKKKNAAMGYEKTNPKQTQSVFSPSCPRRATGYLMSG
jgi:hypothetical protein